MDNEEKIIGMLQGMQTDMKEIRSDIKVLQTDVAGLKTDVAVLKTNVAELKTDVAGLKTDVAGLKTDVAGLKKDVKRLNENVAKIEVEHGQKLSALYDGYLDITRKSEAVPLLEVKVEDHGNRIYALEQSVVKS